MNVVKKVYSNITTYIAIQAFDVAIINFDFDIW